MNRKMFLMLVAVAAVLFSTNAYAQECCKAGDDFFVQVNGYSEKEVVPNLIYVNITINENDSKTVKSKLSVEQLEKDMVATLEKLGIDTKKNLMLDDMSSNFRDFIFRKSEARTSKSYQLLVNDAMMLSKSVIALENIGISNVSINRVSHTDLIGLQNEVRIAAIKNAKDVATSLAEAIGQKATFAISIIDNDRMMSYARNNSPVMVGAKMVAYDSVEAAPEIEFQKIKLTHNVNAKFRLQ